MFRIIIIYIYIYEENNCFKLIIIFYSYITWKLNSDELKRGHGGRGVRHHPLGNI